MLTPEYLDFAAEPILELYEAYQLSVIQDIARRIAKLDYARPAAAWQLQRLIESGRVYNNAIAELSTLLGKSPKVLMEMFKRAGVRTLRFDDSIYRKVGMDPLPLHLSPAMLDVLLVGIRKTQGVFENLTRTTALFGQQAYIQATDLAYLQISTGTFDYQSAIRTAVKTTAENGLHTISFARTVDKADVAIRRAVLTGINQTAGQLQIARANEMGSTLVQVTAHGGARPTHQIWQGKIFSRIGAGKYPDFVTETGYGTGPGLMGWNCRHSFFPFFPGVSENAYSEDARRELANRRVTLDGKELTVYDALQKQRELERTIRKWKRQLEGAKSAGLESSFESGKVHYWQARVRSLVNQTGLKRDYFRESI